MWQRRCYFRLQNIRVQSCMHALFVQHKVCVVLKKVKLQAYRAVSLKFYRITCFFSGFVVKLYFIVATMSALVCHVIIKNTYNYGTGGFFSAKSNSLELQSAGKISHCVTTAELPTEWSQQKAK